MSSLKQIVSFALLIFIASSCTTTHPFIVATDNGDLARVTSMLENDPNLINVRTALHCAIEKGHKDIAEYLISRGADVNAINDDGFTPLKLAVIRGHREIAERLIEHGAIINPVDTVCMSPLHLAAAAGQVDIAKMLIAKGAIVNTQTRDYIQEWAWATISGTTYNEQLVSSRRIIEGRTPLHLAARNGHREMAELLIASGAKVDLQDNNGSTALHFAAAYNHRNVAEILVNKGAAINTRNSSSLITLHTAVVFGNKDMVEFLVSKGAEINAKTKEGHTPLSLALKNKHNEIAEYLRNHGGIE